MEGNSTIAAPAHHVSRRPNIIISNLIVVFAAALAVGLRVVSRRVKHLQLDIDDYAILVALAFAVAITATDMVGCFYGFGQRMDTLTASDYVKASRAFVAHTMIWTAGIPVTKLSILFLYLRVFGNMRYFRIWAWVLGSFCLLWGATGLLVLGLGCMPLSANWDPSSGTCVNLVLFYIISSALEVTTDFLLLLIPLPAVWRLQLPTSRKIELTFTFLFAFFACSIGITRLVVIIRLQSKDLTWELTYPVIWSAAEMCLGIVSACLATLKPLMQEVLQRLRHRGSARFRLREDSIPGLGLPVRQMPSCPFDKYRRPSDFFQRINERRSISSGQQPRLGSPNIIQKPLPALPPLTAQHASHENAQISFSILNKI